MRGILIGLALALVAPAASAQTPQQHDWCYSPTATDDQRIDGCTAVVQSGRETTANQAMAYGNRAYAYLNKGLYDQAIADGTQSLALNPNSAIAHGNRGDAYYFKGLYDQAIADYTRVIALKPDYAFAYEKRGNSYSSKSQYDQAIADYTQAIALKPDTAVAYNGRAWALHKKGEDGLGLLDAERAVALVPEANFVETRAEIYEKLGRRGEAVADYRAALKLDPNMQSARDGLMRLGVTP